MLLAVIIVMAHSWVMIIALIGGLLLVLVEVVWLDMPYLDRITVVFIPALAGVPKVIILGVLKNR